MKGKAKEQRRVQARVAGLVILFVGLLLGATLLLIRAHRGNVADDGLVWTPDYPQMEAGWPERKSVLVPFRVKTVERPDKEIFRELHTEDIVATLNGKPLTLKPDSLINGRDSEPIKTLFMIDCSRSMEDSSSSGVNKLLAAKESLRYFVSKLAGNEQAAIYAFADTQGKIAPLTNSFTNDKTELDEGIDRITAPGRFTNLYDAIGYALDETKPLTDIKVVVLLTDGMEDSPAARTAQNEGYLDSFKRGQEQELSTKARNAGTRIFSIALGQRIDDARLNEMKLNSPESLKFVDFASLKNISEHTSGGFARLIDITTLSGDPALRQSFLTDKLKDVLVEIKKASRFAYALHVPLSELQEGEGELRLDITVPKGNARITHPITYSYTWDKAAGPPVFKPGRVLESIINIKPDLGRGSLTQIYLLLLTPLALLGLLPSVLNRVVRVRELRRIKYAIEVVQSDSLLQGKLCPNEVGPGEQRHLFKEGDTVLVCPKCNTPHHLHCWEYNQHQCMNRVCEYPFVVPARLLDKYKPAAETKQTFV